MGDPDCIILSSDDESKPPVQGAAQPSKRQKSMNVSTRNMSASTRNMNVSTRNMNVSTRNMNVSTRNMSVARRNIPNAKNCFKNIQPTAFQKTNSAAQKFVATYNRTKITELPFNKNQNLKANSNVILNRQTPNVSVTPKQPISPQQQHFKPIRSSNSVPVVQYLHNTKTSSNSQVRTIQQSSAKNKSRVNLNHISQSSSMPVNTKVPNPPPFSNAKSTLMKNVISHPEKSQTVKNSPEKLPPSLLNSLQKNGISVSSLQKCGISVTNVGSDSKDNSEVLNKQPSIASQRNLNHAKFSVKENDAKTNTVPQASSVPPVRNDFIKSNSLCQATIRANKRKIPPTDAGIPNKSICIRKSNSLSANMLMNSNCNSVPKTASISKTLEKSQNKTFDRTPNPPIGSIPSQNQHNVKEIKEWSTKSVSPTVLHTKVIPLVKNPKIATNILPRENIRAINQKYDALKNVSLSSNSQKQQVSSSVVNKNAVNSYSKPKAQVPVANPKSMVMNSATSSSNTPFLNSSLSVTVVNPVKKLDSCAKSSQPIVPPLMVETKPSQPKITNYLTRKNQPLRTNRKSIDLTHDREALLSLLALCESDDYTDTKDTKIKNAKPSDSKITKEKNIKPINSKDSKEKNIEPVVISIDSENESSEESTKKSKISPKFTIKLKEVYKTIRYWPKPVVVLERINALDNHIVSNTSLSKPVTKKTDLLKSKDKLPATPKTTKKNKGKKEKKSPLSRNLKKNPEGIVAQCKNSSITLSDVMKYVDEDFNLQPVENSATFLSKNKSIMSAAVNDDDSLKTVENSVVLLSNNKIPFSEAVTNDVSLKTAENSVTSNNKITLSNTLNDNNSLELVENSMEQFSNNKIILSEAANDKITLSEAANDKITLSEAANDKITLSEAANDDVSLKQVKNSLALSSNTNTLLHTVNGNNSLKPDENSVAQFSNNKVNLSEAANDKITLSEAANDKITLSEAANDKITLSEAANDKITLSDAVNVDVSLKPVKNSLTLSNNTNTLSDTVNYNNLEPVESSVAQFSNNKVTLSEAVSDDVSLKPVENNVLSSNAITLTDIVTDNNSLKPVENSVAQFSINEVTLSEAVSDDSLKPVENHVTSSNAVTLSDTVNVNNSLKPVNSLAQFSNNKVTLSEAIKDDISLKPVENHVTSNNAITLSDAVNDDNSLKPVENSVTQFSNNKITLSEVENHVTSNNAITLSDAVNDDNSLKPVENSVTQFSNNKITLSEAANDDNLKSVENSLTLSNNTINLLDTVNDNNSLEPAENFVAQFSNIKVTLSEAENEDVSLKPVENSVTLSSNNRIILSEAENEDVSLKPVENSVASSDNRITVSEVENDEVNLKLVENSVTLISINKFTLLHTVNDNISLEPIENSMEQFSNNKTTLSEVENEVISLKPVENSVTSSDNRIIISEAENEDASLKPVENSVTLASNNKAPLLDIVNGSINLEPVENSVEQLSNTNITLSETVNEQPTILKTAENSVAQLSSNRVTLSEVLNDDISLKPVENIVELLSDNSMTILDALSDTVSLKPLKSTKSMLSENALVKSAHMDEDDFTSNVSTTNKVFHDTVKSDSSEMVESLLASMISVVETYDVMISDISANGNKNSENNEMSFGSCEEFIRTKSGICSDILPLENMYKETREDQIPCALNNTNKNIQAAPFVSKDSSAVSSYLATELYNNSANYHAEQSTVSVLISDILKKVESMLAVDENITEVQCKSSDNVMNTSEITSVLCNKDTSLINCGLLFIDKSSCSTDNVINNILSSENELCVRNSENDSDFKQNLPSTKAQEISENYVDENLSDKYVKSSSFDDKCDVDMRDDSSYANNVDELNVALNEAQSDQVTSPKLSLKRNRTEMTPDRKVDERSEVESVSKKIKFDERVSDEKLSNKKAKTTISTDFTPTPSTSFASETVIEISDDDEKLPIFIGDEEAEFQTISNVNSGAPICNVLEERRKKFMQLLDFSAPLMGEDSSEEQILQIANRLVNVLDSAQQSYVESENFNFLLDISLEKMNVCNVYTVLNEIKKELKKHKKGNKKAVDNKIFLTDDSISKDIFIDSTSSLPSKDKVTQSNLHSNFNFATRFKDCFKASEKQEPDSASCSSLTSELSKFFASNKNIMDDSGSNSRMATNSNKKLVSDNNITNESSSSAIALGWHSVESNTSKPSSLNNHMSKKFKSAGDDSTSLSKTAIPERTCPVSKNSDENKKDDLSSKQSNRHNSTDDSASNLQPYTNSDKKLVFDSFVTNEFSSSAIASAVGLFPMELKTSKSSSLKDSPKEKLNSTGVAYDASTSGMHLSSATISEHVVPENDVNRESDLSSSRCRSPLAKFLSKNDNSFKRSRSSSTDSEPIDRRTVLEKNEDERNAARIRRLEKHLKELDKAIKRCQQEDLSLDDMDNANSAYLRENKYKKRFVDTYKVLCKLKRVPARTGRIVEKKFRYQGSRYSLINVAIEKLIDSKKVHEKFPDYNEVLNVVKQVHEREDLGFTEVDISNEAKRVFEDIGEQLKERRWRDQRELMGCYLTDDLDLDKDPAECNDRLKKTLEENSKKFNESINQIIDHYVEKQKQTPADENVDDDEEDDAEEDDEKDEDEEETVANTHDDSDDLPGTAPASPENNGGVPVVNIIDRDDDDIEIINFSDKSTDPEGEIKEKQTLTVNAPNISQSIVLEDSESSGDLPSIQELVDKSKIGS